MPKGVRLGLRLRTQFSKWHPGLLRVTFKTAKLHKQESFVILIDGEVQFTTDGNSDTEARLHIQPGFHLIEIAVQSTLHWLYTDKAFSSAAEVYIDSITIEGTEHGGATSCVKCPIGTYSYFAKL